MSNRIIKCELVSTILILIFGVLSHFFYQWSGYNWFVGLFSPINESVWEHLKLLFFPSLLAIIGSYLFIKDIYFVAAKIYGLFLGLFFLVVFFYTYTGIIGESYIVLDIGSFFIAVFIEEIYILKKMRSPFFKISILLLVVFTLCFFLFTFVPPHIPLFQDPLTGNYGIQKK